MSVISTIDINAFLAPVPNPNDLALVSQQLYSACNTWGFFHLVGRNVPHGLNKQLFQCAHEFFSLPEDKKNEMSVTKGGYAWRGYMPSGGGHTWKSGSQRRLYVGPEHPKDHPKVIAQVPLHGVNQFPDDSVPAMRPTSLSTWISLLSLAKHSLMPFLLPLYWTSISSTTTTFNLSHHTV
jgi:isopenicillin N synthase-like dioxygenase